MPTSLLNLLVIAWGVFFFALVLSAPHKRPLAKYMLLTFIVVQMMVSLSAVLSQHTDPPPVLAVYLTDLFYLSGPAFYFFIMALRSPAFRLKWLHLGHALPVLIIPLVFHSFLSRFEAQFPVKSLHQLIMVSGFLCYLLASLRLLPGWWSFQELFAPKKDTIWRWLYLPTLFYIGVYALRFGAHLSEVVAPHVYPGWRFPHVLTLYTRIIFYLLLGIGSYRHRHVYETREEEIPDEAGDEDVADEMGGSGNEGAEAADRTESAEGTKAEAAQAAAPAAWRPAARKPALDEDQVKILWQRLNDYMSSKEPFLDCDLKLPQLSEALHVSTNKLSLAINTCAGQNFHDFINSCRARKARDLIEQHAADDKSMLELSLEAGFGNTATFYKYFKRHFAVTPVQYRRSCQHR